MIIIKQVLGQDKASLILKIVIAWGKNMNCE